MEEDIKLVREMQSNCINKKTYKDDKAQRKAIAIDNVLSRLEELLKTKKELEIYRKRCLGALSFINSRIDGMVPEHYEDLHYILCESEEGEW